MVLDYCESSCLKARLRTRVSWLFFFFIPLQHHRPRLTSEKFKQEVCVSSGDRLWITRQLKRFSLLYFCCFGAARSLFFTHIRFLSPCVNESLNPIHPLCRVAFVQREGLSSAELGPQCAADKPGKQYQFLS